MIFGSIFDICHSHSDFMLHHHRFRDFSDFFIFWYCCRDFWSCICESPAMVSTWYTPQPPDPIEKYPSAQKQLSNCSAELHV